MQRTILLDDDPTGIQTIHGCLVLTDWNVENLKVALSDEIPYFFIFSNTRSLTASEAELVITEISTNLKVAAKELAKDITIICRSDSTLRGHFPLELLTAERILGIDPDVRFFIPAFFEGKRVTKNATHYIREILPNSVEHKEILTRCDQTEFAKDSVFGYSTSYLPKYIRDKVKDSEVFVASIRLDDVRSCDKRKLREKILNFPRGSYCVVDAENYDDLDCISKLISELQGEGKCFSFQSAASFVRTYTKTPVKKVIESFEVNGPGLILAGSHVDKTTRQVNYLMENTDLLSLEISVKEIMDDFVQYLHLMIDKIDDSFKNGRSVLAYTSREELVFDSSVERLEAGKKISKFLIGICSKLQRKPGFLISKGGITSHDTLSKGLVLKQIRVLGQVAPGVPVLMVPETHRFGAIPFVIFPGNVGEDETLAQVFLKMKV